MPTLKKSVRHLTHFSLIGNLSPVCDSLYIPPERIRSLSNVNKDQSEWRLSPSQIMLMACPSPIIELLFDKLNMNNSNFKDRFQDIDSPREKISK